MLSDRDDHARKYYQVSYTPADSVDLLAHLSFRVDDLGLRTGHHEAGLIVARVRAGARERLDFRLPFPLQLIVVQAIAFGYVALCVERAQACVRRNAHQINEFRE